MSMLSTNHALKVTTNHSSTPEVFTFDSYGKAINASKEFSQMNDVKKIEYYLDDTLEAAWYC